MLDNAELETEPSAVFQGCTATLILNMIEWIFEEMKPCAEVMGAWQTPAYLLLRSAVVESSVNDGNQ